MRRNSIFAAPPPVDSDASSVVGSTFPSNPANAELFSIASLLRYPTIPSWPPALSAAARMASFSATVVLFRDPFGLPLGLPDCPGLYGPVILTFSITVGSLTVLWLFFNVAPPLRSNRAPCRRVRWAWALVVRLRYPFSLSRQWLSYSSIPSIDALVVRPGGEGPLVTRKPGSRLRKSGMLRCPRPERLGSPIAFPSERAIGAWTKRFADAIDVREPIGIDRQRRTMIDRGSDFRASNNIPRSVVQTGTFNARGLGTCVPIFSLLHLRDELVFAAAGSFDYSITDQALWPEHRSQQAVDLMPVRSRYGSDQCRPD